MEDREEVSQVYTKGFRVFQKTAQEKEQVRQAKAAYKKANKLKGK